jgi:SAM-dependent methyltransferase
MLNLTNAKQCLQQFRRTPKRVLIVGCGNKCEDVRAFDELLGGQAEIHGVDVLNDTGEGYAGDHVLYIRSDVAKLPVCSRSYDLAYSFATFEHVPQIREGWQRMVDVLRPGGMLYCVASPLWRSPFGHHKRNIFADHPYVHLRYPTPDALMAYCEQQGIKSADSVDLKHHVRYMLDDRMFNKLRAAAYTEAAAALTGCEIQRNTLDLLPQESMAGTDDLLAAGYTREDLLGNTHRLIAVAR